MVNTANDILDINPLERMDKLEEIGNEKKDTIAAKRKELEELERSKKKELEDLDQKKKKEMEDLEKKKQKELDELDKKRKELKDLEDKKIKEIEETQSLIEKSFQDLMRHKRALLHEEEKNQRPKSEAMSLEEIATAAPKIIPEGTGANYGKFFETFEEPQRLYQITNNQFYSGLMDLRNKAATGEITPEEEAFITRLKNRFDDFNSNQSYIENDQNQYLKRSINLLDQINKYHKLKSD